MRNTLVALALCSSFAYAADGLPDPTLTPGAVNQDVTQGNIQDTICVSGWTATIRPPASYTSALKKRQILYYNYQDTNPSHYEEDHLIALELGGDPYDERNLWPQPHYGAWTSAMKDRLENAMKKMVCNGDLPLDQARQEIATDWAAAYQKYMNH